MIDGEMFLEEMVSAGMSPIKSLCKDVNNKLRLYLLLELVEELV